MTLLEWMIYGETGISSKTMWAALLGIEEKGEFRGKGNFDIPYDPDDFSRCYKLWKQCDITPEQLNKVKKAFVWWSPFIDNWDKLVCMYENKDRGIYKYMKTLVDEARILAG